MNTASRHLFLIFILLITKILTSSQTNNHKTAETYKCIPCGYDCDGDIYTKPGKCLKCQMGLVEKTTIKFKTIQPSEICAYIKLHPNVILLDVRTKEEFEGKVDPNFGTLKNAINIPIQELENKLPTISSLKEKEIIVFCSHSHRSPQASYLMNQKGFVNITNMEGGISMLKDKTCLK